MDGPNEIPIEVWRCFDEEGILWLSKLFNIILKTLKMSDERRVRATIKVSSYLVMP